VEVAVAMCNGQIRDVCVGGVAARLHALPSMPSWCVNGLCLCGQHCCHHHGCSYLVVSG